MVYQRLDDVIDYLEVAVHDRQDHYHDEGHTKRDHELVKHVPPRR